MATTYKGIKVNGVKRDEHRVIMEKHIGRKLGRDEIVHHLNGDKRDNRLDNLQIVTRAEHGRMHQTGRILSAETRQKLCEVRKGIPHRYCRKLSDEQVEYIKVCYIPRDKEFGARALGRRFGVSHKTIIEVFGGKRYIDLV
jgi:hypothetical protein